MSTKCFLSDLSGPSKSGRLNALESIRQSTEVDQRWIDILTQIENVPSTITDYREKERYLENLLGQLRQTSPDKCVDDLLIRYLIGSLYINFEKFWGPTMRVIITVLSESKYQQELLTVVCEHLKTTNDYVYQAPSETDPSLLQDRPDHVLHRNFLFQILSRFPVFVQSNNASLVNEFFRFVENELKTSPFIEKYTRQNLVTGDITDASSFSKIGTELDDCQANMAPGNIRHEKKRKILSSDVLKKRKSRETFLTATKVLLTFSDPDKIHRHHELKELLMDLLCCRDPNVQKASFNCLLVFERSHIEPYYEKLVKIMNDKSTRSTLSMFSIDSEENDQILHEHRERMMPILIRILFGKMISKVGKKSSGRDKSDQRKTLIMRFIASCAKEEMMYFFSLLFDPIFAHISTSYDQLEIVIRNQLDIRRFVPLNKLQAMLTSLSAYVRSIGHLRDDLLCNIFKITNLLAYYITWPMEDLDSFKQLPEKSILSLKALKRQIMTLNTEFFTTFGYYNFNQDELNFVFRHLIWTSTKGFIDKNHSNPTPLLRFIESLAANPRYLQLLLKRNPQCQDEHLLQHIVSLFKEDKTKREILKIAASIVANILNPERDLQDDEVESGSEKPSDFVKVHDCVTPIYDRSVYKGLESLKFNQEILLGYIPVIFDRIKRNCQEFLRKKSSEYRIDKSELLILSELSQFIVDPEQSLLAASLLITTASHHKNNDMIVKTLHTAKVLMLQGSDAVDSGIVDLIANLLGQQRNQEQRNILCDFIDVLAEKDTSLRPVSEAIRCMNATCSEMVHTPDLVKWNQGFQIACSYVESLDGKSINEPEVVKNPLILLIFQTGFIVNSIDRFEFSVRENCLMFFEKISQKLSLVDKDKNREFAQLLINDILLEKYVRVGLKSTNEAIKHTYIGMLRSLVIFCHNQNQVLSELNHLTDENPEIDFWLNIKHIQLHNRSRALARLLSSSNLSHISPRTLSAYMMPIATGFLFNKTYKVLASLVENSIKLIGVICKRLNWVTYESTLSYYLGLLTKANSTYQRTNIKLITEIIKNFNFDITACEEATKFDEENAKLEKRMRKRLGANDEVNVAATDAPSGKKLNPSTARMVYFSVTKKLIPRLNSCLHEMTRVEFEHDKQMSDYLPEKDEIKRIPLAFAIVQLLNLLPGRYVLFRDQLPTIFIKLCSFLKSKNESIRKSARLTLIKVMSFVGPAYFPDLLRVMRQNMDRGFQVHVMNYTIHSVLEKIPLRYGDLDHSISSLVECCFQEIFGRVAEDKEIAKILSKTFEAKKTKSYDTLLIIASHVSADKLSYMMGSIKDVLKTVNDVKKVNKLSLVIQKVFAGLAKNVEFPLEKILMFVQAEIGESIPGLRVRQKVDQSDENLNPQKSFREDRYLIAKEPSRDRIKSKINERGNTHMIVENCLKLLLHILESNKSSLQTKDHLKKKLDGFVKLLTTCLKSSSPKCVMRSLKCIYFIAQTKSDLPSFRSKCNSLVRKIFVLLNLYNGVGMAKGDNLEMIGMCFKTLTLLLLRCEQVQLEESQIRALITYIEQDLNDTSRQSTAFKVLYSLVQKKCDSPEMPSIMSRIADILVTSDVDDVRRLSIKIWRVYLLYYSHDSNVLHDHLTRFLRQLDYEFIDGRKSVLKIIEVAVCEFPEKLLREYYQLIFQLLSHRLINEESSEIRVILGRLIGLLAQRLPDAQVYLYTKFVTIWASDENVSLRLLGTKLITVFVESCSDLFTSNKGRTEAILAIIVDSLRVHEHLGIDNGPTETSQTTDSIDRDGSPKETEHAKIKCRSIETKDKLCYHSLRLFKRLLNKGLLNVVDRRYISQLKVIWQDIADSKLNYWHLPVILEACELYRIFLNETKLQEALQKDAPKPSNYLEWNAKRIVRTLCDRYINLLDKAGESRELFSLITETLILLGRFVANSPSTMIFEQDYKKSFGKSNMIEYVLSLDELPNDGFAHDKLPHAISEAKKQVNLYWLSVKIIMQARKEVAIDRLSKHHRRELVLRWTAAIAQELGSKRSIPYSVLFMMTPIRELTDKGKLKTANNEMSQNINVLCEDLLKFMKTLIGNEHFSSIYPKVQLHYAKKRIDRKQKEALLKVKDQAKGIKRKIKLRKGKDKRRKKSASLKRSRAMGFVTNKRARTN